MQIHLKLASERQISSSTYYVVHWRFIFQVLEQNNLTPIRLGAKEGLAMINGTQLITSIGASAVHRAESIARQADVVAVLTIEVLKGTCSAFDAGKNFICQSVWPDVGVKCSPIFQNRPKSCQSFGLILLETFSPRTFKNRPIWSNCCQSTDCHDNWLKWVIPGKF